MLIHDLMKQVEEGTFQSQCRPFADDSVFVDRIHELESIYQRPWYEFMQLMDEHKINPVTEQERLDYAEWRMLCQRFSGALEDGLEGLTITATVGPPIYEPESSVKEGPSNRAFFSLLHLQGVWLFTSL